MTNLYPDAETADDHAVDRDSQAVLDLIAASGRPPLEDMGLRAARQGMRASREAFGARPPETMVENVVALGPHGEIPIRLYRPLGRTDALPEPLLVYFHGGGWILGDIETGDAFCASLAERVGIAVAAVDYRLAPEHRFPIAVDDSFAAVDWLVANAAKLGLRADCVAVCGDSAGGNLAAVCALRAGKGAGPSLRAQILLYPVTDLSMTGDSYRRNATGYGLTASAMRWFMDEYLAEGDAGDWRASPLRAERFDNVTPALIVTCGFDPLCDEGDAYAARLQGAGVPVRHLRYPQQVHGFAMWGKMVSDAERVLQQVADELTLRLG